MYPRNQRDWHALTGNDSYRKEVSRSMSMFSRATNTQQRGYALHRLGDSYSHSKEDGPENAGVQNFFNPTATGEGKAVRDSLDDAQFGTTVIDWGGKHSAVYYGSSKDGTPYVYSKNGVNAKPGVFKLSEVNQIYNADNKIQPTYHNYNPSN